MRVALAAAAGVPGIMAAYPLPLDRFDRAVRTLKLGHVQRRAPTGRFGPVFRFPSTVESSVSGLGRSRTDATLREAAARGATLAFPRSRALETSLETEKVYSTPFSQPVREVVLYRVLFIVD